MRRDLPHPWNSTYLFADRKRSNPSWYNTLDVRFGGGAAGRAGKGRSRSGTDWDVGDDVGVWGRGDGLQALARGQEHSHVGFDTLLDSIFAHDAESLRPDEKGPACLTRHRSNLPGLGADWVEDYV